jgi:2-oxoglutarate ferredoxin oxidoreductase subunit beta
MSCTNCKVKFHDYYSENLYTWCTNCGNYGIAAAEKRALSELEIEPKNAMLCFDIGCNGNGADKIGGYRFHGLHGRIIPFAAGVALANHNLTVVASAGDGATLSEGINHLIHAVRNNYNITFLLHNNSNYGLTKGQASTTTPQNIPMDISPDGVTASTLHVLELIFSLQPSFVARGFSGDVNQLTGIIKAGIQHKGFSFIEILQACPTYNEATPHEWYMERVYDVADVKDYDKTDLRHARHIARDLTEHIATGILFEAPDRPIFDARQANRKNITTNLVEEVQKRDVGELLVGYR